MVNDKLKEKYFKLLNINEWLEAGYDGSIIKVASVEGQHSHSDIVTSVLRAFNNSKVLTIGSLTKRVKNGIAIQDDFVDKFIPFCIEENVDIVIASKKGDNDEATNNAIKKCNAIFITSADNDNADISTNNSYAASDQWIAVGGCYYNWFLKKWYKEKYSNYGNKLDAVAPNITYSNGTSFEMPFYAAQLRMILHWMKINGVDKKMLPTIVEECMIDLGEEGKDIYFGNGVIKMPELSEMNKYKEVLELKEPTIRDLNELEPKVKIMAEALLDECKEQNIKILITETYRTQERQNELYAQGRTAPGNIVTWTKSSKHTERVALDFVPLDDNWNPDWNDIETFKRIGNIAMSIGFTWGYAEWGVDMPHIQYDGDLTIEDVKPDWLVKMDAEYQEAIDIGITDGTRPDDAPTRKETAVMIMRAILKREDDINVK